MNHLSSSFEMIFFIISLCVSLEDLTLKLIFEIEILISLCFLNEINRFQSRLSVLSGYRLLNEEIRSKSSLNTCRKKIEIDIEDEDSINKIINQ